MTIKGLIQKNGKLYVPSEKPLFEKKDINGKTYAEWDPTRSKMAAAIMKGSKETSLSPESKVLYLGAAHGYTVSFLSETAKKIFAVEFSPRVARELILLAGRRKNILPITADANQPESYYHMLDAVDVVYQDIAQRDQVQIFAKNCNTFLKKKGIGMIAIKAKSIDSVSKSSKIFAEAKKQLEQTFRIKDYRNLEPFQKDHAFFVCEKR